MRTLKIWSVVSVCVALYTAPFTVIAQSSQASANDAPPRLEKLEEGPMPAITIRGADTGRRITEKRENGKVIQVKVQSGRSTYYLKPNAPAGSALPGDTQSNETRAPQWQVLEFDFGPPEKAQEIATAHIPAPPPISAVPASPARK